MVWILRKYKLPIHKETSSVMASFGYPYSEIIITLKCRKLKQI